MVVPLSFTNLNRQHLVNKNGDEHAVRHVGGIENVMHLYQSRPRIDACEVLLDREAPSDVVIRLLKKFKWHPTYESVEVSIG